MTSLKLKGLPQKTHRERGQLKSRTKLGLLEKKKDYKLRAENFKRKENLVKNLKKKILFKNEDEFNHKMISLKCRFLKFMI